MTAARIARVVTVLSGIALFLGVSLPAPATLATGRPLHTSKCGWRVVAAPAVVRAEKAHWTESGGGGYRGTLAAVDALSNKNVWTVGKWIEHWDGSKWRIYKPAGTDSLTFDAIAAVSPRNIWAVGGGTYERLIDHWDGKSWTYVPSPDSDYLSAVAASPSQDVWAAGGKLYSNGGDEAWADHWTGKRWVGMEAEPPRTGIPSQLTSIAPLGPHDVIAGDVNSTAMRWNGETWTSTPTPIIVLALAALSPSDVWGVGETGIAHWDGSTWARAELNLPSGWTPYFNSVSADGPNDVWAVGEMDKINAQHYVDGRRALIFRWNGTRWSPVASAPLHAYYKQFTGISTLADGDAWVVGSERPTKKGRALPLIEHYNHC